MQSIKYLAHNVGLTLVNQYCNQRLQCNALLSLRDKLLHQSHHQNLPKEPKQNRESAISDYGNFYGGFSESEQSNHRLQREDGDQVFTYLITDNQLRRWCQQEFAEIADIAYEELRAGNSALTEAGCFFITTDQRGSNGLYQKNTDNHHGRDREKN